MAQTTTNPAAPNFDGGGSRGNRNQTTLQKAFPSSPLFSAAEGADPAYSVATDEAGKYPAYESLLNNKTKAADKEDARVHWGFSNTDETNLDYTGAPDLATFDPNDPANVSGVHYAFAPNLLPPTNADGTINFEPTVDNPVFVAPPSALAQGRKLPIQPNQTSDFSDARKEKPEMIPVDSGGTREFNAETIPVVPPPEEQPALSNAANNDGGA